MAGQDSFEFIGCEKKMRRNDYKSSDEGSDDEDDQRAHIVQSLVHEHGHHPGQTCTDLPLKRLVKGFKTFIHTQYRENPEKFDFLAQTQKPKFLVFSCSDSRVSPSHILDFQLGEAFMAQNIAALIPSFNKLRHSNVGTIIEYAVHELKVENILVIGHSKCGGITRLMAEDKSVPFDFIDDWVNIALPAKIKVQAEHGHLSPQQQIEQCVQESVNLSLENLQTYPYVEKAIEEGKLALRGGFYDFVAGSLKLWELKNSTLSSPILI